MTTNKLNFDYSMLEFAINGEFYGSLALQTQKKNKDNLILFKNRINRFKPKS